ncbi:trans-sialidase, putative, partial [Trypanosoma cruzi]
DFLTELIGGGGSGVKTNDGTLLFPLEAMKKDENKKTVLLVIDPSDTASCTLSKGMPDDGCGDPSVVEWEKDKLMMMTACDDGRRRLYESGDKGESWTEALGTLSRVWVNKKDGRAKTVGSGFITATIDGVENNRNVMLVTLPVYSKNGEENGKGKLHLWLTDKTHIVDIGSISGKDEDVAASSLLYKSGTDDNNELIALYEKKKGGDEKPSPGMVSVRLTEQLQRVKEVLKTWKKADERVSQLCLSEGAAKYPSPDTACSTTGKITDGLVGFLSGSFSDDTWRDEYLGVNATVTKGAEEGAVAEKAETAGSSDGVKFQGAWAEWPVGEQGENQLYHFANYNFTLVAAVSIDGEPKEGNIPVLGVKMAGGEKKKLMELSYDNGKKWQLLCDGEDGDEETQKPYDVTSSSYASGTAVASSYRLPAQQELMAGDTRSDALSLLDRASSASCSINYAALDW